ncbi:MAG: sensor histidine kinase [Actinomycetota bacterium]|nr:sensor histidine kinase [Actinomycetota bacterium]
MGVVGVIGKTLSGVRWRRTLLLGAGAALLTVALAYVLVNSYAIGLSLLRGESLSDDELGRELSSLANLLVWSLPALYMLFTTGAAALLVRASDEVPAWHGVLLGLVSAACVQVLGLAFGPPDARELIFYPLLGAVGGWLGVLLGRFALAGRESLYHTSKAIGAAASPQDVAGAIGEHLARPAEDRVTLWSIAPRDDDGPVELERLGSWAPRGARVWPSGGRLDTGRVPALAGLRRQSSRVLGEADLPAAERGAWGALGIRSALLIPLSASGGGPDGLLVVASRKRRGFSHRRRVRAYLTVGAQAALALENLRLIEEARRSGVIGERKRLAREIHDTLIQGFASIVMNLEAAEGAPEDGVALRHLDEARSTAREGLAEARRIVWALRPEALEEAPLPEALKRLAARWSEASGVEAGVTVTGAPLPLPSEAEVTLLRAAQEALTNVRKHARAGRAVLTLSYIGDRVALDVLDDGVGFEPEGTSKADGTSGGFGLPAMRERVEQSGGTLLVESEPGRGTTLVVELPVGAEIMKETP